MRTREIFLAMPICLYPLLGAKEDISLDTQIGFNGAVYPFTHYIPIKVTLTNKGISPFKGFIGVEEAPLEKVEVAPRREENAVLYPRVYIFLRDKR